jgi:hypothetical protein
MSAASETAEDVADPAVSRDTISVFQPAQSPSSTILFLAADASHNTQLELGEEYRAIDDEIRKARFRDQVLLMSRWAVRPDDLLGALNAHAPRVLHFSGHGSGAQGLCFQSEDGSVAIVSGEALKEVMGAAGASVRLVVLNACYSEVQADAIVAHIPCVIGMTDAVGDKVAIKYAAALYGALAYGYSVAVAHKQGLAAFALHASNGRTRDINAVENAVRSPIPTLVTRRGVDAQRVFLVRPERRRRTWSPAMVAALLFAAAATAAAIALYLHVSPDPDSRWDRPPDLLRPVPKPVPDPDLDRPKSDPDFAVTVQLVPPADAHGNPTCQGGSVTLMIGSGARTQEVSGTGEVRFIELPNSLKDSTVSVAVACRDHEIDPGLDRVTLTPGARYSVALRARCGNMHCDVGETYASCPKDCADPQHYVKHSGPCTRVDGQDIRTVRSSSCPQISLSDPDAEAIAKYERAKGYECTEVFDCKKQGS